MTILDLNTYRTKGVRVFSGRERGKAVRQKAGLETLDRTDEDVVVRIPQDVMSFNPSFILGLFGDSIRRLGLVAFNRKYKFECDPVHEPDIAEAKQRALLESDVLGSVR